MSTFTILWSPSPSLTYLAYSPLPIACQRSLLTTPNDFFIFLAQLSEVAFFLRSWYCVWHTYYFIRKEYHVLWELIFLLIWVMSKTIYDVPQEFLATEMLGVIRFCAKKVSKFEWIFYSTDLAQSLTIFDKTFINVPKFVANRTTYYYWIKFSS